MSEKKTKPVFDTLTCSINIRVDGDVVYSTSDLAEALNTLKLPLTCTVYPEHLDLTYTFVFPPSKADQMRLIDYLVNDVIPRRQGVNFTLNF